MPPKKKQGTTLSLGEFLGGDSLGKGGSWADEVEENYGTQPLPAADRGRYGGGGGGQSSAYTTSNNQGYSSIRDNLPQELPTKPPYTAHLGNLSYDATSESVTDFFSGCKVVNVRIIEDREQNRPKGFAYAEFEDLEGLKEALTRDGVQFEGRSIRVKIADPPKERYGGGGESNRDFSDWSRKGPLPDLPGRSGGDRGGDRGGFGGDRGGDRRGPSDFGERRAPREFQQGSDDGKVRDFSTWERRGPLSPLPQAERRPESRDGSRPRTNDGTRGEFRGPRGASPAAWGPGEGRQGTSTSRPPRREIVDRPERAATAAEKDSQWRNNMRPDLAKSPGESREGSEAPPSPAGTHATLAGGARPKLNLAKRTVTESPAVTSPALSATESKDSKASPFGAARPIDTAAREREIEEKRIQALKEKKEADEKAKEEKRLAKEAALKEAAAKEAAAKDAEVEEAAAKEAAATETAAQEAAAKVATDKAATEAPAAEATAAEPAAEAKPAPQEGSEQKAPVRREPAAKAPPSRAETAGNWRTASGGAPTRGAHVPSGVRGGRGGSVPRGPRNDAGRPPRANGSGPAPAAQPQAPAAAATSGEKSPSAATPDDDGWTTVAPVAKGRRGRA
ncbi:hypothetical protein B0H63DRAFT_71267 [Podospora didyma]|uniref:RRM domain-containing protein n=1 Tax=Podospora didyma TaxID=330526 RepID=A0AAE0N2U1_9PEZI|nr:hypothetical protein B0H63DRAFT_71267 [Podospora didyma]